MDFVREIPDEAVDRHLEHAEKLPTMQSTMHLYPNDGAVHRVGQDETAFSYRDANWSHSADRLSPGGSEARARTERAAEVGPDDYMSFIGDAAGPLALALRRLPEDEREEVKAQLGEPFAPFAADGARSAGMRLGWHPRPSGNHRPRKKAASDSRAGWIVSAPIPWGRTSG